MHGERMLRWNYLWRPLTDGANRVTKTGDRFHGYHTEVFHPQAFTEPYDPRNKACAPVRTRQLVNTITSSPVEHGTLVTTGP